jgi:diguanylate cyclase (GGDEF)-like protein
MDNEKGHKHNFIYMNDRKQHWKTALRIALVYLAFGFLWIFFSDLAVVLLIPDIHFQNTVNMAKGFLFVVFSAMLIYILVAPSLRKLSDKEQVIRENSNELQTMLHYDPLTGLSNRRRLFERLPDFLLESPGTEKALLYIDVDNFKLINDSMGHVFGDVLIAATSKRLSSALQDKNELYRLGGDEFIILTCFENLIDVEEHAAEILELFEKPLSVENLSIHSTISIGIALFPEHSSDHLELLKCADIAMYQAKKNGKNRAILFNSGMMATINERMTIGEQLHEALAKKELEVFYQPQIETSTGRIASYEALLRWTNAALGKVSPEKFISVAEETHLIIPIGEWVLKEACTFLKKMHRAGFEGLSISVNISMIQLLQENFCDKVGQILEETGIDAEKLELEITESILMESYSIICGHLETLRKKGIGIALDDFGKGYSSLSYLEQLPITILKIDKIFIDGISDSPGNTSITGNIVAIGKQLDLTVIAEGVETKEQLAYLAEQKCDKIQGWIFSKALPAAEADAFTRKNLAGRA